MELQIDKKIRQYRKQMDITQGELARILGVSPQSVSKWETGEGYPDITLLPKIANYFNVSIDLLLGNDKATREEDLQKFFRTIREELPQHADEERLRLGLEYAEKYPENDAVAHELCWIIAWQSDKKKREEYLPVLKEQCEKIIRISTEQAYRDSAVELMCSYGTDEEYEKWSAMCPGDYSSVRNEILEKRLLSKERYEECVLRKGANKLELFCHMMHSNCGNWNDPEKTIAWNRYRISLMESFGDGVIPPVWRGWYAVNLVYIADQLFRLGRNEEGYQTLGDAYAQFVQWTAIPDGTALDVGHEWLFHGIRALKNRWHFRFPDGKEEYSNYMSVFTDQRDFLYNVMTMPENWKGFDRVREEERFRKLLERARILADTSTEETGVN